MERGTASAVARWRERRQRGADAPSALTRSGASSGRGLFRQRLARLAAGGDDSAMARWRDRLERATRCCRRQNPPVAEVVAPPQARPAERADSALPTLPEASAGTDAAEAPASAVAASQVELDAAGDVVLARGTQAAGSTPGEPIIGSAAEDGAPAASPTLATPVPEPLPDRLESQRVRPTLKGRAASAILRWRERRRLAAGVAGNQGASGVGTTAVAVAGNSLSTEVLHDALRLLPALALCLIGIALTYGVCVPVAGAPERLYWRRQIAFLVLGLMAYALIAKAVFPVSRRTTMRFLYVLCCVGLPALVLVLGRATGNGTRWLSVAGMPAIQPAEFAKLVLLWAVAELINPAESLGRAAGLRRHLLALVAVAIPAFLVFLERSMGNTALLCLSVGTVLATRWLSWPTLLGLILAGVVGLAPLGHTIREIRRPTPGINVAWLEARQGRSGPNGPPIGLTVREVKSSVAPAGAPGLLSHCPDRFACYLSQDGGWNARQALRCVRIGGVHGCGYRQGSITILGYLPRTVQHTDFIYCVLSESFGFCGALVVLGLIGWLLVAILWTGVCSPHPAAWSFAIGFATLIFLQTLIHVGMALRILPIIGIPLPFVSYGGSFLLTSFAALGLVARYDGPAAVPASASCHRQASAVSADEQLCQPDLISG